MIEIKNFDHYGRGIGKLDNKIIFIKNTIPGEIVNPIILNNKKNYAEGIVNKYIKVSTNRVNPKCPYYNTCGGCDIMHIPYDMQLKFKEDKVKNIVAKYLKNNIYINNIIKCDNELYYRNKVTFQVNNNIGFFEKNSNTFTQIDKCIICNNLINSSIKFLKKLELNKVKKIICRTNGKELMIIIETNDTNIDITPIKEIANSIYLKNENEYIFKYGEENIYQSIGETKYVLSPDSFFQVNTNVAEKLYNKIKELVGNNKKVIDLYCGTGSIGLYLDKTNNVTGIEINKSAHLDSLKNKILNEKENIEFICCDSGIGLKKIKKNADVIIVDPPRNGLNKETIQNIIEFNAKEIIYVSCDIMTFVRDLKTLNNYYEIRSITPFDMFPNTYHVECVCLLELKAL